MMKYLVFFFLLCSPFATVYSQNTVVDGSKVYQTIHTIGVNANPQSWDVNPDSVKSVLNQLIDSLGCTSFRLMFDDCDWEKVNDNDDPNVYNWQYYDSVYRSPRFLGIWEMIRYLNSKGVTDIGLSPDGAGPQWMGVTQLIAGKEGEYAEMIASMINYTKKRLPTPLIFKTISPINETTCGGGEGIVTTPQQFGELYAAVATHLIRDSISDVGIVGPDDCGGWKANVLAMLDNPVIMSKLAFFGQHDYGTRTEKTKELLDVIHQSKYPKTLAVMTEVNAPCIDCDGGVYNKDYGFTAYAGPAYKYFVDQLLTGVNGIQIWEAYDSRYHHPNRTLTWSMWGLFAVNDTLHADVYTARPHFNIAKHLFRFVKAGYKRIDVSTKLTDLTIAAFTDSATHKVVLTGVNTSGKAKQLSLVYRNLPAVAKLQYYFSDATHQFVRRPDLKTSGKNIAALIPAHAAFTIAYEN